MKRWVVLFVVSIFLGACGGGGGGSSTPPPASVDATGVWTGTINSSLSGSGNGVLNVTQSGSNISGTYIASNGAFGTVSGTVSGNSASVRITPMQVGCTGSLSGTGTVTTPASGQPTMSLNYSGSTSCGGSETGSGTLTKQSAVTVDVTGTWNGFVVSSVIVGARNATIVVTQTGSNFTGNYTVSGSIVGTVTGTVNGSTLNFTITPTQPGCTGSLSGTASMVMSNTGKPAMVYNYSGSTTCGGQEAGAGILIMQ